MVSEEVLIEKFKEMDVNPSSHVVEKCILICKTYNVDVEELIEEWMAFSLTNSLGTEPTLESLAILERKVFAKKTITIDNKRSSNVKNNFIYTPTTHHQAEILNTYSLNGSTSKVNRTPKREISPNIDVSKKRSGLERCLNNRFAISAGNNPETNKISTKYKERTDSGVIVCSFGKDNLIKSATWKSLGTNHFIIKQWEEVERMPVNQKYMHVSEFEKYCIETDHSLALVCSIQNNFNLGEVNNIFSTILTADLICGRVCSETMAHLDSHSVYLENIMQVSSNEKIPSNIKLDLKLAKQYCLFPGQTIIVKGVNAEQKRIVVHEMYLDASAPLPEKLPNIEKGPLQIVVAAGPYTQSDNLLYEPLQEIINYISINKPDVAVFIGPFIDIENESIASGKLNETFQDMFLRLSNELIQSLQGLHTQIVFVSSCRDAHHSTVYPTMPYNIGKTLSNVHLVPDPCFLDVNGLIIGITSVDVIAHLEQEEICMPVMPDSLHRLGSHIIAQRTMYPLMPSNKNISLDHLLWEKYAIFGKTPHIIILPSKLQCFIKTFKDCILINPEYAAKGNVGGTFVRMEIHPNQVKQSVIDNIACQIIKI